MGGMSNQQRTMAKKEVFTLAAPPPARTTEDVERAYVEATKVHPFRDNADSDADIYKNITFRDAEGNIVGVLIQRGLPEFAATMAANVLRPAATRTSLRASIFGGESPLSGIAGYFDYRGSPIEFKNRKTSFTHEYTEQWPGVFPMIDYVSGIYRTVLPECWARQDSAIPDIVRIHGSPFSTLTINSRFRTASHTDAGDFDDGFGCLACLEGDFKGLALSFDSFRVNVTLQPRDVLLFNPHHFHSNTEPEVSGAAPQGWSRLTCVFYYRAALGEPSAYADYKRRLQVAKQTQPRAQLPVDKVVVKENGNNFNRPASVYPVCLTPFGVVASVHCMWRWASKARILDAWLRESAEAEMLLFGEPLVVADGIPDRCAEELYMVLDTSAVKTLIGGGFRESDAALSTLAERQRYLEVASLSQCIGRELLGMWQGARKTWLRSVKEEWDKMTRRNPDRREFTWNNHSDMNAAFFDLCEVAKQVMLDMLGKEDPSNREEQSFWTLYALHLNKACITELGMPEEAMSLRKLNVKLKDYTFGGTRYFKDMPEEEQQRRLLRKQRIEEVRRHGKVVKQTSSWLENDSFDYQSEDCPVDYVASNWPDPAEHARAIVFKDSEGPILASATAHMGIDSDPGGAIRVLVVLARPAEGPVGDRTAANLCGNTSAEAARLLGNPAAVRLLSGGRGSEGVPSMVESGGVRIEYVHCGDEPTDCVFDVVVLRHVLNSMEDGAAAEYVKRMALVTSGCLLVEETDIQCRRYYRLTDPIRLEYDTVAERCFALLHGAKHGIKNPVLRTKHELEEIVGEQCVARFKFRGSALNSTLLILPGVGVPTP